MARRSYDQMYKSYDEKREEIPVVKEDLEIVEEKNEEKKESKVEKKTSIGGIVIGGKSLNIREVPNGTVIGSLIDGTRVKITDDSDPEWYKIEPKGYVMKKFIKKED